MASFVSLDSKFDPEGRTGVPALFPVGANPFPPQLYSHFSYKQQADSMYIDSSQAKLWEDSRSWGTKTETRPNSFLTELYKIPW